MFCSIKTSQGWKLFLVKHQEQEKSGFGKWIKLLQWPIYQKFIYKDFFFFKQLYSLYLI